LKPDAANQAIEVVADAGRTEGRSTKQISLNHRPRTGSLAKANPYPAVKNPKI